MSDLEVVNEAKNKAIRRAEIAEKRIAELEKKAKNAWDENVRLVVNLRNEIESLKKENAELKEDNSEWEKASDKWKSVYEITNNQLTKAKSLLKQFLTHYENKTIYVENMSELLSDAEQFISEVEK